MTQITFMEHSGKEHRVEATDGESVMQAAVNRLVPGILADCGGNCACATCHVYIESPWRERLKPPSKEEAEMIEGALYVQDTSRLCCQIQVTAELEGLVVKMPESQT